MAKQKTKARNEEINIETLVGLLHKVLSTPGFTLEEKARLADAVIRAHPGWTSRPASIVSSFFGFFTYKNTAFQPQTPVCVR